MMKYYINTLKNNKGRNELHHEDCRCIQMSHHLEFMGTFDDDEKALAETQKKYPLAKSCKICCPVYHESSFGLMGLYY